MKKVLLLSSLLAIAIGGCKDRGEAADTKVIVAHYASNNGNSHVMIVQKVPKETVSGAFFQIKNIDGTNERADYDIPVYDTTGHPGELYQYDYDLPEEDQ